MESASRLDQNHQLSIKEFPYIIKWREDRCTRCGRCTAVCPVKAIEPTVYTQRVVTSEGSSPEPKVTRRLTHVVKPVNGDRTLLHRLRHLRAGLPHGGDLPGVQFPAQVLPS